MKEKQKIMCNVHSCDFNNCDCNECTLKKIEISCEGNNDNITAKRMTICKSFKNTKKE